MTTTRRYDHDGTFWRFSFHVSGANSEFVYRSTSYEGPREKALRRCRKVLKTLWPQSRLRLRSTRRDRKAEEFYQRRGERPWSDRIAPAYTKKLKERADARGGKR